MKNCSSKSSHVKWPAVGVKSWPEHTHQGAPGGQADSPGGYHLTAGRTHSICALEKGSPRTGGKPGEEMPTERVGVRAERQQRPALPTWQRGPVADSVAMAPGASWPRFESYLTLFQVYNLSTSCNFCEPLFSQF